MYVDFLHDSMSAVKWRKAKSSKRGERIGVTEADHGISEIYASTRPCHDSRDGDSLRDKIKDDHGIVERNICFVDTCDRLDDSVQEQNRDTDPVTDYIQSRSQDGEQTTMKKVDEVHVMQQERQVDLVLYLLDYSKLYNKLWFWILC